MAGSDQQSLSAAATTVGTRATAEPDVSSTRQQGLTAPTRGNTTQAGTLFLPLFCSSGHVEAVRPLLWILQPLFRLVGQCLFYQTIDDLKQSIWDLNPNIKNFDLSVFDENYFN